MAHKQPAVDSVPGRGDRIKATENHFNMRHLQPEERSTDYHQQILVQQPELSAEMQEYLKSFDGVNDSGANG